MGTPNDPSDVPEVHPADRQVKLSRVIRCSYCRAQVLSSARKCRSCGEWFDEGDNQPIRTEIGSSFKAVSTRSAVVMIAGIIWIVVGSLVPLMILLSILVLITGGQAKANGGFSGGKLLFWIGVAFLVVGVQSLRGSARDTLGNGIGSIFLGLPHSL